MNFFQYHMNRWIGDKAGKKSPAEPQKQIVSNPQPKVAGRLTMSTPLEPQRAINQTPMEPIFSPAGKAIGTAGMNQSQNIPMDGGMAGLLPLYNMYSGGNTIQDLIRMLQMAKMRG